MNKNFIDQVESTARLQFKLFEAETKVEEMIDQVKVFDVSDEVRQKLFSWINEMRPNLMQSILRCRIRRLPVLNYARRGNEEHFPVDDS